MKKSILRATLCSTATFAIPAVPAAVLLPSQAAAQTTCSGTLVLVGTDIECVDGTTVVVDGITDTTTVVNPVAQGLSTTSAGNQTVLLFPGTTGNTISTTADGAAAISLTSAGTLDVSGAGVNASTTGDNLADAAALFGTDITATLGDLSTTGVNAFPLYAVGNGNIDITTGTLTATGNTSIGGRVFNASPTGATTVTTDGITTTGATFSPGLSVAATGTGPVSTTTLGAISTTGTNSDGLVVVSSGTGPISALFHDVATTGAGSEAVNISGLGNVTVNQVGTGATSSTTAANTDAVVLSGLDVTGTLGNIRATGAGSQGLVVTATDDIALTVGNVLSDAEGVTATAAGDLDIVTGNVTTVAAGAEGLTLTGTNVTAVCGNVTTAGNNAVGVLANATATLDLTCAAINTTGDFSEGAVLTGDTIIADIGAITTDGLDADGVTANATGDLDLTVDSVTTLAEDSNGLSLVADNIVAVCGNVATAGAGSIGIDAMATGAIDITCAAVATTGDFADGVVLTGDTITADLGSVTTDGTDSDAVVATATGDLDIVTGTVATLQNDSDGLVLSAENVTAVCGNVTTAGNNSIGVDATATAVLDLTCTTVRTTGDASDGVVLAGSDVTADLGTVSTDGIGSDAIIATATGNLNVEADSVTTLANDSDGIVLTSANTVLVCGNVRTSGTSSVGIDATGTAALNVTCASVGTTGTDSDAVVLTGGSVTGTLGPITASGTGSSGLVVDATGPVSLVTGLVSSDDNGIVIDAGANNVTLTCGAVTTTEADAPATTINATGTINATCGVQTTAGANSDGLQINGGAGPITATVAGAVTTGADSEGVDIAGTGAVTFTNTGLIRTTGAGSTGVEITGGTTANVQCGNITTTGANSPAFDLAANGNTTVTCGVINTSGINSDGINVTNASGTTTVTGGTTTTTGAGSIGIDVATQGTGAVTVNTGTVTSSGAGSPAAVRAVANGCATVNVNVTNDVTSTTGAAVLASSLCAVNITSTAGSSILGATSGINATSGTGTTITLNDSVRATAGPAIDANGAAAVVNVNAGGSIIGRIDLTDNADTLNNRGLFDVIGTSQFGLGADVVNNFAGATVRSTGGAGVLAGCETFNNSGTVTMIDGAANDTLTVCTNYVGSGAATLGIDLAGSGGALIADRLIVPGNASGTTAVTLNVLAGAAVIDPDGVLIVDAGTATGSPFTMSPFNIGLIDFGLEQRGADTFIASRPNERIFEVARLNTMLQDMWYQSADAYLSCAASRRNDFGLNDTKPVGVCAQLYGSTDRWGDDDRSATVFDTDLTFSDRTKTKRRGAQVDVAFSSNRVHAGLTAGYSHAEAAPSTGSDFDIEGRNYGAFAQFGAEQGPYGGVMVKWENYDARLSNATFIPLVEVGGEAFGADGEVGFRTTNFGPLVDFNVGVSHVRTKMDDFMAGNIEFDAESRTSTRGRVGVRAGWAGMYAPFIDAKLFHEFSGDNDVEVRSGGVFDTISARGRGTWGRLEAGLGGAAGGGPLLSVWTDLGDVKGWGLRGGFRF